MKKDDWQKLHGFTDDEMALITSLLKTFNGKIVGIYDVDPSKPIYLRP